MTPRLSASAYERNKGDKNKRALKRLVDAGDPPPGIVGYVDGTPTAWCAIEPRSAFVRLERSRVLKPVDDAPVWSIVCLFIAKPHRRQGASRALIRAAVNHARDHGARIVEAYPIAPRQASMPDVFAWTGLLSAFLREGFREVARRSPTRPIVRKRLRARR